MKLDTKAIRARAEAATAGPWGVWEDHAEIWAGLIENTPGMVRAKKGGGPIGSFEQIDDDMDDDDFDGEDSSQQSIDNAVFAAAARTDVPALCARVEALEAALRYVRVMFHDAPGTQRYIDAALEGGEPCR